MATQPNQQPAWKEYEKIAFRIAFIYFLLQIIPLDWKYYRTIFSINWSHLRYHDLFSLTNYYPQFITSSTLPEAGFLNWLIIFIVAVIGAVIWGNREADRKEYNVLYYWLRVVLRYRLAIGVIGYGIIKVFPVQMPGPTLSDLNTPYGDYYAWKIYALTTGVATTYYQSFLGLVEIIGGLLLLNRKTATLGASLLTAFLFNVVIVNFAYDIHDQVYSAYLLVIALALLAYDSPRLYNLLVLRRKAQANKFRITLSAKWQQQLKVAAPIVVLLFTFIYGYKTYSDYHNNTYAFPTTRGLKDTYGYYNVREFSYNNQVIPYSLTDLNRWQNVVFEKWATISIRTARPIQIISDNGNTGYQDDQNNNYELAGAGGRRYFTYTADTIKHELHLKNKNVNEQTEQWTLHYDRPDSATLILSGVNEKRDSVRIVLDKINKTYLQLKGRRKPLVL